MVVQVAILDDDRKDLNQVSDYFNHVSSIEYNCSCFTEPCDDFYKPYDVYVIDIELNHDNGLNVANKLRQLYPHSILILNSKRNDLVFDSFEIGVFYFTRKDHFEKDMAIAQNKLNEHFKMIRKVYHFQNKEMIYDIPYQDILYIEKVNHSIHIHLENKVLIQQQSMKNLVHEFELPLFVQCHQSYLVNLSYVKYLDKNDFVMKNNERVQISKRLFQDTKKAYITFLSNKVTS